MKTKRIGIIMNGVTGRMGTNQHLVRSVLEIMKQGGVALKDGTRLMPDPILVGRNATKLEPLARAHGVARWTTDDEGVPPLDAVVSAVTGEGIADLVGRMAELVREARAAEAEPEAFVVHRPVPEGIRVDRLDDGSFVVAGRDAERAVALNDLTNPEALDVAWGRLRGLGVGRALIRAGAMPGDTVVIGSLAFDYEPDAL